MVNIGDLEGEWTLLSAELTADGKTNSIFDTNRSFVKIFTKTHFAFFSRLPNREPFSTEVTDEERLAGAKSFDAGAGKYELAGTDYIEHIEYCSYPNYEGQSIAFKLSLVDGILTQEGIYPLERLGFASKDGYLVETYKRLGSAS